MNSPLSLVYSNVSRARTAPSDTSILTLHDELRGIAMERSGGYSKPNDVIRLPLDPHMLVEVKRAAEAFYTSQLKYVLVIGIGGSNLGARAVYEALRGSLDHLTSRVPKMLFLDTISATLIHDMEEIFRNDIVTKEEIVINLISKSGTTTESVMNFELIVSALSKHVSGIEERIICTTDQDSPMWKIAEKKSYGLLAIPKLVGGRFSVFSPVGLFPLLIAGIDVVGFQNGGRDMLARSFSLNPDNDLPRHAAEMLFGEIQKGISMLNIFHFHPELESLGKWERQLIAESLGKEHDLSGKIIHSGITPIVSIGSTDLHSMAQLYFGGPRDKFTTLIKSDHVSSRRVGNEPRLAALSESVVGRGPNDVMNAIYGGVVSAYKKHQLPLLEVTLPAVSPFTIGAYMEWRMLTTIYLARLMYVNPFDQPNVEDYKKETRRLLTNP
jgi:glucose-6-phosphate isomerase